jgi:hypothetical protein
VADPTAGATLSGRVTMSRSRRTMASIVALFMLVLIPGPPALASTAAGHSAAAQHQHHQRLRVLTLNIFYGGDDLDLTT